VEVKAVILDDKTTDRPDISYPTRWGFKLIGRDREAIYACIKEVMRDREHECSVGNSSKTGKFHSYNTSCIVESEEERNRLFKCFEEHKDIKMVI
jgi:putative lipoic acid-binding regulatory protein